MSLILLLLIDVNGPERHHAINIFRRGCGGVPPQTPPFMVASSFSKMLEGSCGWVGVLVCGWVSGTKRGDGVFLTRFGWRDRKSITYVAWSMDCKGYPNNNPWKSGTQFKHQASVLSPVNTPRKLKHL